MSDLKYAKYFYKPKRGRRKAFIIIFFLLILCGGALYSLFFLDFNKLYTEIINLYRITFNDYRFLQKNLDSGNYNVVIHESEPYLLKKPYNPQLLRYLGEAYYFIHELDRKRKGRIDREIDTLSQKGNRAFVI